VTATKGERTRTSILASAVERFGRDGFRSTSVADIARDAAVSGTAAYAYFPNKEALFLAALDEDAAALIDKGLARIVDAPDAPDWRQELVFTLVDAMDDHPLARRVLAGLEPEVTERVLEIPALAEMRKAMAERIRSEQLEGRMRRDIDPTTIGNGVVAILLSLLMSVVQVGTKVGFAYANDVAAVFEAALEITPPPAN